MAVRGAASSPGPGRPMDPAMRELSDVTGRVHVDWFSIGGTGAAQGGCSEPGRDGGAGPASAPWRCHRVGRSARNSDPRLCGTGRSLRRGRRAGAIGGAIGGSTGSILAPCSTVPSSTASGAGASPALSVLGGAPARAVGIDASPVARVTARTPARRTRSHRRRAMPGAPTGTRPATSAAACRSAASPPGAGILRAASVRARTAWPRIP